MEPQKIIDRFVNGVNFSIERSGWTYLVDGIPVPEEVWRDALQLAQASATCAELADISSIMRR